MVFTGAGEGQEPADFYGQAGVEGFAERVGLLHV